MEQTRSSPASLSFQPGNTRCEPIRPLRYCVAMDIDMDMDSPQLIQTLIESFSALAGEVQGLVDRKTILEHKLRFAHEQVRLLFLFFPLHSPFLPGRGLLHMMNNSSRSAICRKAKLCRQPLYHLSDTPNTPHIILQLLLPCHIQSY